MSQLIVKDLTLGYGRHTVAEGLSFQVDKGNYLCIVGENGSGKSTLIKALLGLHPQISGTITEGEGFAGKSIGYLPQQTEIQRDFPASVYEIVLSGFVGRMGLRPFYTSAEKQAAKRNMEKLGISALASRCYRELSGGQQQRALLARALCAASHMLLLDEPVAGLDPRVTEEMYELIERLNREDGMTVIMVSHDLAAAKKYASHILHIHADHHFFGTKEQYLARQEFMGGAV